MAMLHTINDKVRWEKTNCIFDRRTYNMLRWMEEDLGFELHPGQGSFSTSVGASGSTHSGEGAVDLSIRWYPMKQQYQIDHSAKDVGFAFWIRPEVKGLWPRHGHGIAIGDDGVAASAAGQVASFLRGRDGLTGNRPDNSYRPSPRVEFDFVANRPLKASRLFDGVPPEYELVIVAQDTGLNNKAAWRLACRLYDLGYFVGKPRPQGQQGYPEKAMQSWQAANGMLSTGRYGSKAHMMLFGVRP